MKSKLIEDDFIDNIPHEQNKIGAKMSADIIKEIIIIRQCSKCGSLDVTPVPGDNVMYTCNECSEEMVPTETTKEELKKEETKMVKEEKKGCSECGDKVLAKGLCSKHYYSPASVLLMDVQKGGVGHNPVPAGQCPIAKPGDKIRIKQVDEVGRYKLLPVKTCATCIHMHVCFILQANKKIDIHEVVCENHKE